jgi:hypothetical protein
MFGAIESGLLLLAPYGTVDSEAYVSKAGLSQYQLVNLFLRLKSKQGHRSHVLRVDIRVIRIWFSVSDLNRPRASQSLDISTCGQTSENLNRRSAVAHLVRYHDAPQCTFHEAASTGSLCG